jgi:hypothetical protein
VWCISDCNSWGTSPLLFPSPLCDLIFVQAERAFKFWVTGVSTAGIADRKEEAKFSEDNWGVSTMDYIKSINKLTPRQWKKIKDAAIGLTEKPKLSVSLTQGANASPLNARGSLFEEDSEAEE